MFAHILDYLRAMRNFCALPFFVRFQDWIPCIQYQLRKNRQRKEPCFMKFGKWVVKCRIPILVLAVGPFPDRYDHDADQLRYADLPAR